MDHNSNTSLSPLAPHPSSSLLPAANCLWPTDGEEHGGNEWGWPVIGPNLQRLLGTFLCGNLHFQLWPWPPIPRPRKILFCISSPRGASPGAVAATALISEQPALFRVRSCSSHSVSGVLSRNPGCFIMRKNSSARKQCSMLTPSL